MPIPSVLIHPHPTEVPISYWQSLNYFNLYRLSVAGVFVVSYVLFGATLSFGEYDPFLFFRTSIAYVFLGIILAVLISLRWPRFSYQLRLQVIADVLFLSVLMYASGGVSSGLGLLLLIPLAGIGLVDRGRLALFYAALASIAVLLMQGYRSMTITAPTEELLHAGFLSMGMFTTAGLASIMGGRIVASEQVARQRSIDVRNLSQVNQLVIQDLPEGVVIVDSSAKVLQHNAQVQKWLGVPPLVAGGASLQDYLPALAERFRRWSNDKNVRFDPLRVQSTGIQLQTRFVPIGEDPSMGAVLFLEDLGRLKTQAQQFKLAALGRLTANIAHEIRNPLSAISYATQLLQEEHGKDLTQVRLLQIIQDNTQRLDKMIQDVLQLNRRDRAERKPIPMEEFLEDFVNQFCQVEKIHDHCLSVEVETDKGLCFDPTHLNQVLWNLCRNAWRYCGKSQSSIRLCVSVAHLENTVQLDVIDDGPGVDREIQHQLFEPFFSTEAQGTGLGLYVAREICEANEATLDYVELAPGGQFRICGKSEPC